MRRLRLTEVIQPADIRNAAAPNLPVPNNPIYRGRRGSPAIGQFLLLACCSQEVAGYCLVLAIYYVTADFALNQLLLSSGR